MKRLLPLLLLSAGMGLFHSHAAQAQTVVTGTFTFTGNVYLRSTIPSGNTIWCQVTMTSSDTNGTNTETVYVEAALVSGQHWQCVPVIHYDWHLNNPASDIIEIVWTSGIGPTTLQTNNSFQFARVGTHSLPAVMGVPATSWTRTDDDYL